MWRVLYMTTIAGDMTVFSPRDAFISVIMPECKPLTGKAFKLRSGGWVYEIGHFVFVIETGKKEAYKPVFRFGVFHLELPTNLFVEIVLYCSVRSSNK